MEIVDEIEMRKFKISINRYSNSVRLGLGLNNNYDDSNEIEFYINILFWCISFTY